MKVISKKPITWAEAKELLQKKVKEGEASFEQTQTYEYLTKVTKISSSAASKLFQEIKEAVPILKEEHIVQIVNIMPSLKEELENFFPKKEISLKQEEINKILEILGKYK
ncbi:MAG: hypothetical protein DRO65_04150 [Candidatus Altiarchaeales archaeon]|nr:MAG: hypothetical protein DRO65_04150 [Candidatus Altiarchaeales archaeon]